MKNWYKCLNIGQQHHCSSVIELEKALLVSLFPSPLIITFCRETFLQQFYLLSLISPYRQPVFRKPHQNSGRNRLFSKWIPDHRNAKMTLKLFCSNLRCKDLPLLRFLTVNHCAWSKCKYHLCTFFPNKDVCVLFIVIKSMFKLQIINLWE